MEYKQRFASFYINCGHTNIVNELASLSNGLLATVIIWNTNTWALVYTLTGHNGNVWSLASL